MAARAGQSDFLFLKLLSCKLIQMVLMRMTMPLKRNGLQDVLLDVDDETNTIVPIAGRCADFVHRGSAMDGYCLWDFVAEIGKVKLASVWTWAPRAVEAYDVLRKRAKRYIPVPIGPALPRGDRPEVYERYCRLMLIL